MSSDRCQRTAANQVEYPLNVGVELLLRDAEPALRARVQKLPSIVVLDYPASEKDNTLHHLLIGHEIGHCLAA